jgi:TP901 family phage tail tape measure protein
MSRFVLTAQLQLQAPNNVAQVVRQIQSQLNNVNVNVQVQGAAQAQRQLQQVTTQTQAATTAADRMGRAFAISIRRFAAFSIATRAVGLFTSTLSDAISTAIDFEREMVRVSQVTGESIGKLQFLTKAITDLSTGLGVSSKDLLNTGQLLLQAGVNAKDTEIALKTLAKAALAPNFDSLSETTEGAIAILAQFQEGVGALEKQLGAINAVAGAFAVEAGDLIDVIRRAGGVFKSSGGDLNELIALFTSVRATTRESAESIGTGLRTIFTRIQRPKTIEYLKQFGVELVDLEGKFVGPFEAVKRLSAALSGLGEGDITFIRIAEELGGFRQIGKVLPLLQQFSTAQAALNVAQKAGNSLTTDAATAQQALAIRILKVKEEFLALIRSVTETSTFQVMANTALSLASALIKIGEAIKPLLPLLAAVAAVNFAKGIGTFAGGLMRGMQSGRTYNKGGKVHHFARGGMVPGTGNRDTVPAMLQPGEFVIKKSSVNKLGASNLAAMNENRYNVGGMMTTAQKIAAARNQNLPSEPNKQKTKSYNDGQKKPVRFSVADGSIGAFFMNPEGATDGDKPFGKKEFDITNKRILSLSGISAKQKRPVDKQGKSLPKMPGEIYPSVAKGILEPGNIKAFFPSLQDVSQGSFGEIVQRTVKQKLSEAVMDSASTVENQLGSPLNANKSALKTTASQRIQQDLGAIRTTSGYLFEGIIDALSGARPASNQSTFDFPASSLQGNRKRLSALFGPLGKLGQADAKASFSTDIISGSKSGSLVNKIINSINNGVLGGIRMIPQKKNLGGIIQKFAKGGMATAPLIDDIVNATNTIMPRPSSAIAALISAGGGAIDIDRTIKRTIGDKAYGMAKTSSQQSAALDRYFRDPQARLRDVTSAPLTTFGRELQGAIKSGQLQPGKLSIVSKSQRVPGVAEYLTRLFGIPLANMIFTGGGSKQPAMDALRTKGPRAMRKFATGGGVGTDTVPALLTPGEFVINRSSAQKIGYGNLNRMNKVGRYAKGGVVQKFAAGGRASGGDAMYQSVVAPNLSPLFASVTKTISLFDKLSGGTLLKLTSVIERLAGSMGGGTSEFARFRMNLNRLDYIAPGFMQAFEENSKANKRNGLKQVQLAGVIDNHIAALQNAGASQALIKRTVEDYVKQLTTNTTQLKAGVSLPAMAASAPSGTPSQTGPAPLRGQYGTIPRRSSSATPTQPLQGPPSGGGGGGGPVPSNTQAVVANTNAQRGAASSAMQVVNNNKMFAASMATSLIAGFLPAVDENSSAILRLTHSFLGLVTTIASVGFALESFGLKLTKQGVMDFLGGGKGMMGSGKGFQKGLWQTGRGASTTARTAGIQAGRFANNLGASDKLSGGIAKVVTGFTNLLGPILAITAAAALGATIFRTLYDEIYNFNNRLKNAINEGNVEKARSVATEKSAMGVKSVGTVGSAAAAGALAGSFLPGIGTAIGGAVGAVVGGLFVLYDAVGDSAKQQIALAVAQAGAVKTQKQLEQAQKTATNAMEDFERGSISASEALAKIRAATSEVVNQEGRAADLSVANAEGRSTGAGAFFRNAGAYLGGGLFGMETANTRNQRLGASSAEQIRQASRFSAEAFQMESGARSATIRSGLFGNQSKESIRNQALGVGTANDLQKRLAQQIELVNTLQDKGDEQGAAAARESVNQLSGQINQVNRELANLEKEVQAAKDKFAALNLGFRSVTAAADASALRMQQAMSSFDLAAIPGVNAMQTLEAALTAAGQNISKAEFDSSLGEVSNILKKFGADAKQVTAFEDLTKGVAAVQRDFPNIFDTLKQRLKGGEKDMSPEALGKEFKNIVAESLDKAGIGEAAKKRIIDSMGDVQINPEDMAKLMAGDVSVLEKYFGDAAEEVGKNVKGFMDKWISANQELITATQQRIEAERNLVAAQKEAVDLYMEGREVQAKYGGRAVSTEERRAAIVAKANAGASGAGIGAMRTGSVAELRQRQTQIFGGFGRIEGMRGREDSAMGAKGQELEGTQQNLQQAQKDQVETIRALIKLEEEELKIIQEKNKLEKDSLESLISGDIEKFFEQQSALGAQAAIASGDTQFASLFGADTLGKAFQDMQRQMEAGVQSMFGQQLGGPGGLLERAAGTALSARGVTDPRSAQVLAGTTAEEESIKRTLQDLGGVLGEAGAAGAAMAEMQVQTAQMKVEKAEIVIANLDTGGAPPAAGMYRGGVVYANRGIFVPRGTDTVPAMLTPGEFVVRREAVNRGNNLQLLRAMNNGGNANGMARGGKVGYYNNGGIVQYKALGDLVANLGKSVGISPELISNLGNVFSRFITGFNESIQNLQNTKLQVKLDSVNVNVNLNSSSALNEISQQAKQNIINEVINKLKSEYGIGGDGKLQENKSSLPRPGVGS